RLCRRTSWLGREAPMQRPGTSLCRRSRGLHSRRRPARPTHANVSGNCFELKPSGPDPPRLRRNPAKAGAPSLTREDSYLRALIIALAALSVTSGLILGLAPAAFAKGERPTTQAQVDYPAFAS